MLPGGLSAQELTPGAQEEGEGVNMPVNTEHMLPVVRVGEIKSEESAQRWLVEGLWGARSVGVIGGAPKCAKTWLGLDMALSVATGTACLGKYAVPEPGPVLIYLAEDALLVVRERIEGMARHRGLDLGQVEIDVITAPVLRLDRDRDRTRLLETTKRLRPRLLLPDRSPVRKQARRPLRAPRNNEDDLKYGNCTKSARARLAELLCRECADRVWAVHRFLSRREQMDPRRDRADAERRHDQRDGAAQELGLLRVRDLAEEFDMRFGEKRLNHLLEIIVIGRVDFRRDLER